MSKQSPSGSNAGNNKNAAVQPKQNNRALSPADKKSAMLDRRAKAIAIAQRQSLQQKSKKQAGLDKDGKKGNIFSRIGAALVRVGKFLARKFREMKSELKKVTWPTYKHTFNQTLVVLSVVLCFLVVLFFMDWGLSSLLKLLVKGGA